MKIIQKQAGKCTVEIIGNIVGIQQGDPDALVMKKIPSGTLQFGLGLGSFSEDVHIGECLVVAGKPHISWVDNAKLHTKVDSSFGTIFIAGIDKDQTPSSLIHYKSEKPTMLWEFYDELGKHYPEGCCVLGYSSFTELHASYLKKAPIYGDDVVGKDYETYWTTVSKKEQNTLLTFGISMPKEGQVTHLRL